MEIRTVTEFKRLFLRESENKNGERCLIGKVVDKTTTPPTDLIVVCNPDTMKLCEISQRGRWDVEVKPMKSGKGFVVVAGSWAYDKIELSIEDFKVQLLINGRAEKLKDGDKYIPLFFDCKNYYEPKKIVRAIRQKLSYMQLPEEMDVDGAMEHFLEVCKDVEKEYKKSIDKTSR